MTTLRTLLRDESGQGTTEYAILLGTLALGAVFSFLAISGRLLSVFNYVSTSVNTLPTS